MAPNPTWSHHEEAVPAGATVTSSALDDAEKGLYDSTPSLPVISPPAAHVDEKKELYIETQLSPSSPVHEGLTPLASITQLALAKQGSTSSTANTTVAAPPTAPPTAAKKKPPKPKVSRWILFQLWFNTYRKFFTFVTLLNLTGIILAALGRFPYAENHLGALVLGNLLMAVLMRNELFLRFLYLISIYGLRSVCSPR